MAGPGAAGRSPGRRGFEKPRSGPSSPIHLRAPDRAALSPHLLLRPEPCRRKCRAHREGPQVAKCERGFATRGLLPCAWCLQLAGSCRSCTALEAGRGAGVEDAQGEGCTARPFRKYGCVCVCLCECECVHWGLDGVLSLAQSSTVFALLVARPEVAARVSWRPRRGRQDISDCRGHPPFVLMCWGLLF